MKPTHCIVGMGEIGRALADVLLGAGHEVATKDIEEKELPKEPKVLHVCLNFHALGADRFTAIVRGYLDQVRPHLLDICSTVTPGTTETFGPRACHSTTRGLHPNLVSGLLAITKHIGGPRAADLAKIYREAGVRCATHRIARTTELLHILNNSAYGVELMFADEAYELCREYGVDYFNFMKYTQTHNDGFSALDHERLVRPILTPPYGHIGGHCVTQGASLIPEAKRGKLIQALSSYNMARPGFSEGSESEVAQLVAAHDEDSNAKGA